MQERHALCRSLEAGVGFLHHDIGKGGRITESPSPTVSAKGRNEFQEPLSENTPMCYYIADQDADLPRSRVRCRSMRSGRKRCSAISGPWRDESAHLGVCSDREP